MGQGIFGTGAVCSDEAGTYIGVLAVPGKGYLSPQTCEFLALINGLHFFLQAGFSHLDVEGDAQNIFAALASNQEDVSSEGALVDESKVLLSRF
ncbi:putative ribonuclease H-like domain-containing protein [Rosa chinensis]|uniref:Putative ribonuclease H-like domain-containing protein n=1 Tax=Rosa chinensis TaxID=74649 RepID=A0A2P6RRN1_ROSCH|nr:putative ribonuclease H-like domain-containing protein [Rosa chinensis]